MTLTEAFEEKTVQELKRYVNALRGVPGVPKPEGTRMAQLIRYLVVHLSDARTTGAIWEALDSLERRFVSHALADEGRADVLAFAAQYEAIPASLQRRTFYQRHREATLLALIFHREPPSSPRAARRSQPSGDAQGGASRLRPPRPASGTVPVDRFGRGAQLRRVAAGRRDPAAAPRGHRGRRLARPARLTGAGAQLRAGGTVDRAVILTVRTPAAMQAILGERALTKAIHASAGDTIVISTKREARFRKRLRELG